MHAISLISTICLPVLVNLSKVIVLSVCCGLVGEYFIKKKFPNIMGLSYVHESPYIMGLSYVLSIMGLSYVQRFPNIMGLSYVQSPLFYYGAFLCTISL